MTTASNEPNTPPIQIDFERLLQYFDLYAGIVAKYAKLRVGNGPAKDSGMAEQLATARGSTRADELTTRVFIEVMNNWKMPGHRHLPTAEDLIKLARNIATTHYGPGYNLGVNPSNEPVHPETLAATHLAPSQQEFYALLMLEVLNIKQIATIMDLPVHEVERLAKETRQGIEGHLETDD